MNVKAIFTGLFLTFVSAVLAQAQGFAGLGQEVDGFKNPMRGAPFDFPTDHGPHPEYRIEWWYLTTNLRGADGKDYGAQWTLFRSAREPRSDDTWNSPQSWMGHAAITTETDHFSAERFARGGAGQAGAVGSPFEAWIDDWKMSGADDLSELQVTARGSNFSYDLALNATGPLIFHGDRGYSVKSVEGQASYYYSQPFYEVTGQIETPEGVVAVTGNAWLDREYSSQPLGRTQSGWDWFSLSFDDGNKLMGFLLRDTEGDTFTAGTWITPEGETTALENGQFQAQALEITDVDGRQVPTTWQVTLPPYGIDVTVEAINPQAWMDVIFSYWEGPVRVSGSHSGIGYLEMTGYE